MGRPSKRTPENMAAIVTALEQAHTKAAAAASAGMTYQTLREWEKDDAEFSEAIEKAEAKAQVRLLDRVSSDKSWQAHAWILERRWPREYGRREAVEMTGKDGGPIDHRNISELPDHERRALAEAIRDHLAARRATERSGVPSGAEPGD